MERVSPSKEAVMWIMKNICEIKEIYRTAAAKSIYELRNEVAPYQKDKVLEYLRNGAKGAVSPAIPLDVITGEPIQGTLTTMNDGKYYWRSDLIYYVEKYNLDLPKCFLKDIDAI